MARYILTVTVPDRKMFDTYWYGVGLVVAEVEVPKGITVVVDYGGDAYRAWYQRDRFASGMYFGLVDEVAEATDDF